MYLIDNSVSESKDLPQDARDLLPRFLLSAASAQRPIILTLPPDNNEDDSDPTGLQRALKSLTDASGKGRGQEHASALPNRIKFPYSRHSSYRELCYLLQVLKPKDVWPCTVDPVRWIKQGETLCSLPAIIISFVSLTISKPGTTIEGLFGEYCTGNDFQHDEYMVQLAARMPVDDSEHQHSQTSVESVAGEQRQTAHVPISEAPRDPLPPNKTLTSSQATTASLPSVHNGNEDGSSIREPADSKQQIIDLTLESDASQEALGHRDNSNASKRLYEEYAEKQPTFVQEDRNGESTNEDTSIRVDSQSSSISARRLETRRNAFNAMFAESSVNSIWNGLLSTTNNHTHPESELGEG